MLARSRFAFGFGAVVVAVVQLQRHADGTAAGTAAAVDRGQAGTPGLVAAAADAAGV